MEARCPDGFEEVSKADFDWLFGNLDFEREAFCGGEYYHAKGYVYTVQERYADGSVRTLRLGQRIGFHCARKDRYFVDPKIFVKKVA